MDIKINDLVMIRKHIYRVTQDDNGDIVLRSTINWFNYKKYPDIDMVKKSNKDIKVIEPKNLHLRVRADRYYDANIIIPNDMDLDDAIKYAKENLIYIPVTHLEYVPESDYIDEEDIEYGRTYIEEKELFI